MWILAGAAGLIIVLSFGLAGSITGPVRKVIEGLGKNTGHVYHAAAAFARSSSVLSQGAAEQAASVEEILAGLENIRASIGRSLEISGISEILVREASETIREADP